MIVKCGNFVSHIEVFCYYNNIIYYRKKIFPDKIEANQLYFKASEHLPK